MPIQAAQFNKFEKYEGFPRTLRFDMNALADFEQETGMGFGQLMSQRAVFAVVRGLLWAGFQHEDRRITPRRVGELVQQYVEDPESGSNDISDLLTIAVQVAQDQGAFGRAEDFGKKSLAAARPVAENPSPAFAQEAPRPSTPHLVTDNPGETGL
jgi:hypothetical protein